MNLQPKENKLVSPYFAFYLINTMQVGVGVLGFQRYIAKSAGHDAWMAVITGGILIHLLVWMSYRMLKNSGGDLVAVHEDIAGKAIGGALSTLFTVYSGFLALTVLRTYIEVIQVWMFPHINIWGISLILLGVVYYFVSGGFRIVTALGFFSVILGTPLIFLKYFAVKDSHIYNILPLFDHSVTDFFVATKTMTLNYLGFEMLLLYYPFIKHPEKSEKWSQWGVFFTILVYTITAVESFAYYSQGQLKHTIWATLTLWKIVEFPFVERFEYIGISMWLFVVLPNVCIAVWCVTRGFKRVYSIKQKHTLIPVLILIFAGTLFFKDRQEIDLLNSLVSKAGYYIIYFYIPLLFVLHWLVLKVRRKKDA
ncbi:spore germination protein (amino acid permease) [Fictibacillus solisalsi]|uniref:Spore germination protein (Amino acid permease) n=1 Tax=Fictibacillus solisalsi TaxID=459525 RepID=A0A1G9U8C3_9BACL|nr:GerAB/ArcD/ProY family transporter [Fictibacillus solisalsi]SDM56128.1 spore germination protein (amino acid permease) [Fictibacillus solisalsi]